MIVARRPVAPACLVAALLLGSALPARADLDEYVKAPDPSFAWSRAGTEESPAGKVHLFRLTSQTWQGIRWEHQLRVYEPAAVKYPDRALLFITGGSTTSRRGPNDDAQGFALAAACGARVAALPQVPNQPLLGDKKEDDLIAETFVRYLETRDETWPLLFPMVKSAVRAMDAVQAWAKEEGKPVTSFVVTGASKRGWTTWLTGASDPRVAAIAPMVIPTLNMKAQGRHQLEAWGKYSEQIEDYVRRGLLERFDEPDGRRLWQMIDPFTYRDRLTMPKLQINGTNDRYWTLDSLNLYWGELKGPSYVVYLPNAGHNLKEHTDYAINGVGALFRHVASRQPLPEVRWEFGEEPNGAPSFKVRTMPAYKSARIWQAKAPTQDFREARWESPGEAFANSQSLRHFGSRPETGFGAMFVDLSFEVDGLDYHLSTQIRIVGPKAVQ